MKKSYLDKWLHAFPLVGMDKFYVPDSLLEGGSLNSELIKEIEAFPKKELSYVFGNDLSFSISGINFDQKNPFFLRERRRFIRLLEAMHEETHDDWLLARRDEILGFRPQEILMLSLQGVMDPENPKMKARIIPGSLSDITEYRFGPEPYGVGYYDHPYTEKDDGKKEGDLEIRIKPLPPLEFVAAYNHALYEVTKALHAFDPNYSNPFIFGFESHLNMSGWRGGKPFAGGKNVFDLKTEKDRDFASKIISGLCAWQGGAACSPSRHDTIRLARGRVEVRSLSQKVNARGFHIARSVLEAIVFSEAGIYGVKNIDPPKKDIALEKEYPEQELLKFFPPSKVVERTIFNGENWLGFMLSVATINEDGSLDWRHHYDHEEYIPLGEGYFKLREIGPSIRVQKKGGNYVFSVIPELLPELARPHKDSLEKELNDSFEKTIPAIVNKGRDAGDKDGDVMALLAVMNPVLSILTPDVNKLLRESVIRDAAKLMNLLQKSASRPGGEIYR